MAVSKDLHCSRKRQRVLLSSHGITDYHICEEHRQQGKTGKSTAAASGSYKSNSAIRGSTQSAKEQQLGLSATVQLLRGLVCIMSKSGARRYFPRPHPSQQGGSGSATFADQQAFRGPPQT